MVSRGMSADIFYHMGYWGLRYSTEVCIVWRCAHCCYFLDDDESCCCLSASSLMLLVSLLFSASGVGSSVREMNVGVRLY